MNASDVVPVTEESDRVTTDRLMADFRMLAADMEHLLKAAGNQTGQHAAQLRVKAEDSLRSAKAHVAEVAKFVAKTATEVHGGMGFTDLLGLHYWFKRIGLNRQLLGSPERLRNDAARLQGLIA